MVRNEKTRQFIIEKTAKIFNKKGYAGTYLSDLTQATGLTKGSIYGNFKDKNEVAVEAFKYNHRLLTQQIAAKIKMADQADRKLKVFFDFYRTEYKKVFENGGCAILNTAVDADDGNEQLKVEVIKALNAWRSTLEEIINYGIERGELKYTDAHAFANKMIAMVEGSILIAKTLNEPEVLIRNIELLEYEIESLTTN